MNNIYQELYKKNGLQSKRSDEVKKQCFVVWKDKRNEIFDAKRETLVCEKKVNFKSNDKENEKPNKNMLIKWKNERKKNAPPQKKPPFVVGIVRHKIHSPPFLHKSKSVKSTEQKKKIHRQSFAPKNYKFKPPEGLKVKVLKPISEKDVPFTLSNLFDAKKHQITPSKKGHAYENVTVRPRAKLLIDSNLKVTPKRIKINQDIANQKCNAGKDKLNTNTVEEPPIFGKLNLLKFRENTTKAKENDIPKDVITSEHSISNQNVENSKSVNISCQSTLTKVNSEEKECNFKLPTSYSCSQQIQNLLEQRDFRFTELHCNSESNQVMKRTSEMPSPNISRISFTITDLPKIHDRINSSKEKNIAENIDEQRNNSLEDSGSLINDELNSTIYKSEDSFIDEEVKRCLNFSCTFKTPKHSNFESTMFEVAVNEEYSNIIQNDLPLSKIVDSPVKRISEEKLLPEIKNNKQKFNKLNSLNLDPESERYEKESHLNEKELTLEKVELSINSSKTSHESSLEIENNVLSNSKNSIQENSPITPTDFNIAERNMVVADIQNEQGALQHAEASIDNNSVTTNCNIKDNTYFIVAEESMNKADVPNEHKLLQCIEAAIENTAVTEKHGRKDNTTFNVAEENMNKTDIPNEHKLLQYAEATELKELSPRDQNNTFDLKNKIISKIILESDQKSKNLNEFSDDFIKREKSATLLNQLSHPVINCMSNDKIEKNENNKIQPEIIDISDSPLKKDKDICEKNPVLRRLYNNITKDLLSSPSESLDKSIKAELSSSKRISEILQLEDSLKVEKDLSISLTAQDKFYHNFKESQKKPVSVSDDKSTKNSQTTEIETVDLISDDEEDSQSFLSHIKARFAITTISSPKINVERKALTSIENIQNSPCKAQQSPMFLKENSPEPQNISIRVSLCKTQQSPIIEKQNSLTITEESPKTDVALSPKKTKNQQRKTLLENCNLSIVNSQTPKKLNENMVSASSLKNNQVQTEENSFVLNCVTTQQELLKENSPTSSSVTSQTRILSLRNRKVDVSPSPKKLRNTARKALLSKNHLPDDQTPNNNFSERNIDKVAVSSLEDVQNSSCNSLQLQDQAKENKIPIRIIPCDTPRPKLLIKENSPVISVAASPIKILSLRSRKIDVSPSPKKTKKTPKKALFTKNNLSNENGETPKNNIDELNENRIATTMLENVQNITYNTPQLQEQKKVNNIQLHISPCEAVRPKLLGKEDSPVTNTVSSPMRILCLRGRKVDVTPSPKKKTPSRTPRKKRTPVK